MNTEVPRKDFFESQKIKRGFYTGVTLSLLLCGATLWFNLREVSAQKNNIAKVVIAVPTQSEHGKSVVNGAKLALEAVGVINGRKVVAEVIDTGDSRGISIMAQEAAAAQNAVKDARTVAYIGPFDDVSVQVVTPVLNAGYIINIPVASSVESMHHKEINKDYLKLFPTSFRSSIRVVPNETVAEHALVRILETLKLQSIVIVGNEAPHQAVGPEIVQVSPDAFTLSEIKKGTAVYVALKPNDPALAGLVKQFSGSTVPIILNSEFYRTSQGFIIDQQTTNPIYVVALGGNETVVRKDAPKFADRFNEKYGADPDAYALAGYDAAAAIIEIMRSTPSVTRGAYMTALAQLMSFSGSYQKTFLDNQGEVKNNVVTLYKLQNESLDYITSYIYEHQ